MSFTATDCRYCSSPHFDVLILTTVTIVAKRMFKRSVWVTRKIRCRILVLRHATWVDTGSTGRRREIARRQQVCVRDLRPPGGGREINALRDLTEDPHPSPQAIRNDVTVRACRACVAREMWLLPWLPERSFFG